MMARARLVLRILPVLVAFCAACNSDDPPTPAGPGDDGGNVNPPPPTGALTADHACADAFAAIPADAIAAAADLRIFYGHTSHGSQLMTGLAMLEDADPACTPPVVTEVAGDLGTLGDLTWAATTRARLEQHPGEDDVVIWSWCGGCSTNTPEGIDAYLQAMTQLEADYPDVVFVYMTGHLDGTGPGGTLYASNNRIRSYCADHGKWLFDFADIESYDPDGTYYPDESDACGWCEDWCATHECATCYLCAHSRCFNCWRKGQAFWWLLARVAGGDGQGA